MLYLFGLVCLQIVIESLPVSSSGNCVLWTHLMELYTNIKTCAVPVDIDFLLHGPTIVVVGLYFFDTIWWYLLHIRQMYKQIVSFSVMCFISGFITALLYVPIRQCKLVTIPLWVGFVITAALLFSLVRCKQKETKKILTWQDVVVLGLVQGCALLPGISRFASTYVAARWLGFYNYHAFGYSFAVQLPLLGAAFLKGLYGIYAGTVAVDIFTLPLLSVIVLSTLLSYVVFAWVGRLAVSGQMYAFGWYVVGTAIVAYSYGL